MLELLLLGVLRLPGVSARCFLVVMGLRTPSAPGFIFFWGEGVDYKPTAKQHKQGCKTLSANHQASDGLLWPLNKDWNQARTFLQRFYSAGHSRSFLDTQLKTSSQGRIMNTRNSTGPKRQEIWSLRFQRFVQASHGGVGASLLELRFTTGASLHYWSFTTGASLHYWSFASLLELRFTTGASLHYWSFASLLELHFTTGASLHYWSFTSLLELQY
uniref:Secreted protein n=2 Tax=Gasterosteus aculeatus TaxID=69293 RepID=G3PGK1_GASAC